jgi:hypothetical protein
MTHASDLQVEIQPTIRVRRRAPTEAPARATMGWAGMALLLALGLGVRAFGLLWGGVHPDENIGQSAKVLAGQIVPDYHFYPPLLNYLNGAAFAVMYALGRLLGTWPSTAAFRAQYFEDPSPFYAAARAVTALLGAWAGPLAAMIAARCGVRRSGCLFAGAVVAFLPAHVLLSHISKSDAALSVAFLAMALAYLRVMEIQSWRRTLAFAAACAVALSFKQTALFLVVPLGLMVLWQVGRASGWGPGLRWAVMSGGAALAIWTPLNIGILLDLSDFLQFQRVQASMSLREAAPLQTLALAAPLILGRPTGVGFLLGGLALLFPVVQRTREARGLWSAAMVGLGVTLWLAGDRLPSNLLLPWMVLLACIAAVGIAALMERRDPRARWAGIAAMACSLVFAGAGSVEVDREAVQTPVAQRVAEALVQTVGLEPGTRILAYRHELVGLPRDPASEEADQQRSVRLAERYGVTLPERAPERSSERSRASYYITGIPFAMGGLERRADDDGGPVVAFAWPIQQEEFNLDYWLQRGYSVFVVQDEAMFRSCPIEAYRRLHEQIAARCELVQDIPDVRRRFFEGPVRIYRYTKDPAPGAPMQ